MAKNNISFTATDVLMVNSLVKIANLLGKSGFTMSETIADDLIKSIVVEAKRKAKKVNKLKKKIKKLKCEVGDDECESKGEVVKKANDETSGKLLSYDEVINQYGEKCIRHLKSNARTRYKKIQEDPAIPEFSARNKLTNRVDTNIEASKFYQLENGGLKVKIKLPERVVLTYIWEVSKVDSDTEENRWNESNDYSQGTWILRSSN
ncbi:MAG: hypothetical protein ACOYO1_05030 [Bacteroidales bacterium]